MKKILTIVTGTRAEYGLLKPIIEKFITQGLLEIRVVVTGSHLSQEFGLTYKEIENDGIFIDRKIEMLLSSDTSSAVTKSMGLALLGFADYFAENPSDAVMLLGDRYEILAVGISAINTRIPVIHLHGGEITTGAIDDIYRHMLSKLSSLHFASTDIYRDRIIQLGEEPNRVFTVGAMGVENALNVPVLSKEELSIALDFDLTREYCLVTYHPVTQNRYSAEKEIIALLEALTKMNHYNYIITKANADSEGRIINFHIEEFARKNSNVKIFTSLGLLRYLNTMRYCQMIIGNSSSGILEAPSFMIPTINIGDRQKGRLQSESVINCEPNFEEIIGAMKFAVSDSFRKKLLTVENPYGEGNTSDMIVNITTQFLNDEILNTNKKFFDLIKADY